MHGMVQRFGLVPTVLQSPPDPPPQSVGSEQVFELNRSNRASHVVAVWLMPQYFVDAAPERLVVVMGTVYGAEQPVVPTLSTVWRQ
jgi:hypothetical protein